MATSAAVRSFALNDLRRAREEMARCRPRLEEAEARVSASKEKLSELALATEKAGARLQKRLQEVQVLRDRVKAALAREERVVSSAGKLGLSARDLDHGSQPEG